MGLFDDLFITARDVVSNISKRAEEVYDVSKIRLEIRDLQKQKDKHYVALGKLYEQTLKNGVDNSKKGFVLLLKIEELEKELIKRKSMIDYKDNKDDLSDPIYQSEDYSVYDSNSTFQYNDFYKK